MPLSAKEHHVGQGGTALARAVPFSGLTAILDEVASLHKPLILDLGVMTPSVFSFFSEHKCKIFFECLSDPLQCNPEISVDEINTIVDEQLLNYGADQQFDVILSWDLLNYLNLDTIKKLAERLKPHCRSNTLFHMIKYTGTRIPQTPCEFKVIDQNHFTTSPNTLSERRVGVHSTYHLLKHMSQFLIQNELKGEIIQRHFTEHLLRFSPDSNVRKQFVTTNEKTVAKVDPVTRGLLHRSPGIHSVCQHLNTVKNSNVLDLGPKVGQNVEVLSQYCKRVYVEDIYSSLMNWKKIQGEGANRSFSQNALNFDSSTRFDAIILWDVVNYFTIEQITLLGQRLAPYCNQGTRVFMMVYSLENIPQRPQRFFLHNDKKLIIQPVSSAPREHARKTITQLLKYLSRFKADGAYLLQDGMQSGVGEYLLSYQGGQQ
jgi:2-polyprenyl-3-methyl-5-hydroxy-6-metoxy-1,4-benzoquinol methylase